MPDPAPTPPDPTLAERLERLRARSGLGLNEVARRSGIAAGKLWEILRGRNDNPKIQTIEKVVRAMGFTLADLFADEPPENPENPGQGG